MADRIPLYKGVNSFQADGNFRVLITSTGPTIVFDNGVYNDNTETPNYEHPCDRCVFLGIYKEFDLYYCPLDPTVIARYSNDGPDYYSGLNSHMAPLKEAQKRALELGLLTKNDLKHG